MTDVAYLPDFFDVLRALQKGKLTLAFPILLNKVGEDAINPIKDRLNLNLIQVFI